MAKTVLICDDSLLMRRMIAEALSHRDWRTIEACDGQEAVDLYRQHRPDAVTMDLVMPHFDGMHGLKGIIELDPEAKIVVVSAVEQTKAISEAVRSGAHDFIVKPFLPEQLLDTLERCVAESTQQAV